MIPKIIHQVFHNIQKKELNEISLFVNSQKTLQEVNDDFEYKLWTEKDCIELITNHYPSYLEFYLSMEYQIQRIDYIRMFILHRYGGFYIDLDMIAIKPLRSLINEKLILNNINHIVPKHNEYVINDFMACEKNDPFFKLLMDAVPINYKQKLKIDVYKIWKGRFVIQTTGPKFISRMVKKYLPNYKPYNIVWTKWRNDNWKEIPRNKYYVECFRAGSWLNETNSNLKNHKTFK